MRDLPKDEFKEFQRLLGLVLANLVKAAGHPDDSRKTEAWALEITSQCRWLRILIQSARNESDFATCGHLFDNLVDSCARMVAELGLSSISQPEG